MKAYQYRLGGSMKDLSIVERAPPRPGPGQVLVRMRAASLNYRDILVVTGKYPRAQQDSIIPLSDGAGEITELGAGVTGFSVGDRVAALFFQSWTRGEMRDRDSHTALGGSIDGVAAQYCVFSADSTLRIPEHMSFEEGATLPCAALTAWNGVTGPRAVRSGDTVLTLGTGGVSIFALQLAKSAGASVIVTSSSDEKLARARKLGADDAINYVTTPDWHVAVRGLTGGRGVDHVIETAGGGTMERSIASTRRGGFIHVIGLVAPGQFDPVHILLGGVTLRGTEGGSLEMFASMNRAMAQAKIKPVIDRVFAFEALPAALDYLQTGRHFGKIVVTIA